MGLPSSEFEINKEYKFRRLHGLNHPVHPDTNNAYGGSYIENLSSFRSGVGMEIIKVRAGRTHITSKETYLLAFDIERHSPCSEAFSLLSFTYSMMIDRYDPKKKGRGIKSKPTKLEFATAITQLDGFVSFEGKPNTLYELWFRNTEKNVFANWMARSRYGERAIAEVRIGVIQEKPMPDLRTVTDEIVPYAVRVFNHLNPTRVISANLVEKSIRIALKSNEIPIKKSDKEV